MRLNTSAPTTSEPVVDYRALSNPLDLEILAEFVRFTRAYHYNTSLAEYDPYEMLPGPEVTSDEDIAAYIRRSLSPSEYHPSGTAAMLPRALGGVVDEQLKVYGVRGLRVIDASVMPTLPGANTCQTVYAVAEKVSSRCSLLASVPRQKERAGGITPPRQVEQGNFRANKWDYAGG